MRILHPCIHFCIYPLLKRFIFSLLHLFTFSSLHFFIFELWWFFTFAPFRLFTFSLLWKSYKVNGAFWVAKRAADYAEKRNSKVWIWVTNALGCPRANCPTKSPPCFVFKNRLGRFFNPKDAPRSQLMQKRSLFFEAYCEKIADTF